MSEFTVFEVEKIKSFDASLEKSVLYWISVGMSDEQISRKILMVHKAIRSLSYCPYRFERVNHVYGLRDDTRRILIRNAHAVFYQVKLTTPLVVVGAIYNQRQLNVSF